jgi:uncharacterized protein (AIM24 family)
MQYDIKLASQGIGSAVFSGEGFVCLFTGPGTIYVQTRSIRVSPATMRPPRLPQM